jgi:hypothetical protein
MSRVRTREWSSIDYYAVLGVSPDAGASVIDARYRALAKEMHPDRTSDQIVIERFKRVNAAYAVLRDAKTRTDYDEFRARVAEGRLYTAPSAPSRPPRPAKVSYDHLAPPRVPKARAPMPDWLRTTIAGVLVVCGLLALGWAIVGDLHGPTAGDTPVGIQITLVIVAVKLVVCGALVAYYPQLKARFTTRPAVGS